MDVRGVVCAVLVTAMASASFAEDVKPAASPHVMVDADRIVWGPGPPALPRGASAVVLSGNPAEPGPFTLRLKLPAGFRIPPHRHPVAEHQTILEGTYAVGTGERFDEAALHTMRAGSFAIMPARTPHFGYTKDGAVLQVHGIGPFTVTYVDPADDPRKPAANRP